MWVSVNLGEITGWLAVSLVAVAASVPIGHRIVARRRAVLASPAVRSHVGVGLAAATGGFVHALSILPSLGSSAAVSAGMEALGPGALAFLLLVAHMGVGLRLRNPKLRDRARVRRTHLGLATSITIVVAAHAIILLRQ